MKIFKKLNARGIAHPAVLLVIVLGVAIFGTYELVRNYADTPPSPSDYTAKLNAACRPVVKAAQRLYPKLPDSVNAKCVSKLQDTLANAMKYTTPLSPNDNRVTGGNLAACQIPVNWFDQNQATVRKAHVFKTAYQQRTSMANLNTLASACSVVAGNADRQANLAEINYLKNLNRGRVVVKSPPTQPAPPPSFFTGFFSLPVASEANIPLVNAINAAQNSVELVDYTFHSAALKQALVNAATRGVAVRVILDGHDGKNATAYNDLQKAGVPVKFGDISHYTITHEKSVLIDHAQAYIGTYNMSTCVYTTRRDFGVIDSNPNDVNAWLTVFNADWNDQLLSTTPTGDNLIWSPNSAQRLIDLINSAQSSINFYDETLNNESIIQALIAAASRGVTVRGVMTDQTQFESYYSELTNGGVQLHLFPDDNNALYIHAKAIVADDKTAYMGSINFTNQSTNTARELGIITADSAIVNGINTVFATDWSTPGANSLSVLGGSPPPASCGASDSE
ncbi:MAG TPA: phospholipase D-like domain-containing protein [Candidatus Saccharimonadales bacterium]|nr:phospholipase D-like domain-containing protein [Candidatus Saccharimonadales bacterium]